VGILFKKYLWILNLFLIILGSLYLAKITTLVIANKLRIEKKLEIAKVGPVVSSLAGPSSFEDYKVILDRNIFDSKGSAKDTEEVTSVPTEVNLEGPAVKTTLPIKVMSTVSVGQGTDKRSSVVISSGSGGSSLETYSVGDEKQFSSGVKLTKILPDRIEFINGPRLEFAEIETLGSGLTTSQPTSATSGSALPPTKGQTDSVEQVGQGKFVVDRGEIENALGSIDQVFTQIRAVPQFQGGKPSGLKLLSIRGGSIFAKLGLKRNDVLKRINGQEVDLKKGIEIFSQLKEANQITIDLERGGKKTTLEYSIQ
jgi:type II secretion system protein C